MKSLKIAGVFVAFALAGCGKEPEAITPPAPAPVATSATQSAPVSVAGKSSALTTAELDKVAKPTKPVKLALIVKTRNNPFFDPMIKAAETQAKAMGVTLEVQAPAQESDKERQFALVQDVTARGANAILITPADSKGIIPALKQAQAKGVAVINLDNRVDAASAQAAGVQLGGYVGANNEAGGTLAGEVMVEILGGKGKVAILEGIRGADNAEARKRGFTSAAGKLGIVASDSANWDTAQAYAKFQSIMAAHPDLNGVFCANDKMALGAIKAIREGGKKGKITVVGYDNIPDVKQYLQSGEMAATIDQHPDLMGRYGVQMALGVLDGKLQKGGELLVPLEVIRK